VGWRTAMIIPELASELATTQRIGPRLAELEEAIEQRAAVQRDGQRTRAEIERLERMLEGASGSAEEARDELRRRRDGMRERAEALDGEHRRLHDVIARLDDECNEAYHPRWGPLFREGNDISRFGHQVKDFACIYTARVSNFLNYPVDTYFRAPMQRMPHEL